MFYLSLPSIVDRGGVERMLNLQLDENEIHGLQQSARVLRETLDQLSL